jgi:hypothetical protein
LPDSDENVSTKIRQRPSVRPDQLFFGEGA